MSDWQQAQESSHDVVGTALSLVRTHACILHVHMRAYTRSRLQPLAPQTTAAHRLHARQTPAHRPHSCALPSAAATPTSETVSNPPHRPHALGPPTVIVKYSASCQGMRSIT